MASNKGQRKGRKNLRWIRGIDCRECPFPRLRAAGLCPLCATLCEDDDGKRVFSVKPIIEPTEV